VVIYPEGVWYRVNSTADADAVLIRHVQQGGRVTELMLPARADAE
jgi:(2Fe-2S) ferredoxin